MEGLSNLEVLRFATLVRLHVTIPPKGLQKGYPKKWVFFDVLGDWDQGCSKEVPRDAQWVPKVAKMVSKKWRIDSKGYLM